MRFFGSLRNQSGNTLTMVLVATAMLGIFSLIYANMMSGMNRSLQGMSEKVEIMQLQQLLMGALANAEVCTCNFDPSKNVDRAEFLKFNSNNPESANLDLNTVFGACDADRPKGELVRSAAALNKGTIRVKSVQLKGIEPTGSSNRFRGEMMVDFDSEKMVLSRKPISIPINFVADASSPTEAKIISCSSGADFASLAPPPPSSGGDGGGGGGGQPPPLSCQSTSMRVTKSSGTTKNGVKCTPYGCTCPAEKVAQQCHASATLEHQVIAPDGSNTTMLSYRSAMGVGSGGASCSWNSLGLSGVSYSIEATVACCQ